MTKNVKQWAQKNCLIATLTVFAAVCIPGAALAQGNIEAAGFNSQNSVQTENCAEGGLDVGYISNGSWLSFNQINLNGVSTFQARVASGGNGGTISVHLDSPSGTVIGTAQVAPTGGWQTWTTVTANVYGASGFHNVYLVFTGAGGLFNIEWFALNAGARTTAASYANAYNVQTENCSEGGRDVGYLVNGSYIEFSQMNLAGVTTFNARTASGASGGTISIHLDSPTGTLIGTVQAPPTGGWQSWSTETVPVSGASGYHNVYLVFSAGFNVEWFSLSSGGNTEAASYNNANNIKTENCSEGGLDVGYIVNGSYLGFNQVNLQGATSFTARTASGGSGGSIAVHLDSPNGTLIGTMTAPGTGGWQTWSTQTISLNGAGGYHNVYLVFSGGLNIEWFTFGSAAPTQSSSSSSSSASVSSSSSSSGSLSLLHAAGTQIVNASGTPVQLKGVNLGSLMLMEGWMCPLDSGGLPDNYSVIQKLDSRFGVAAEQNMIHCYQTNWITTTDLQNIKNAGFNCVRVPVWWGNFYTLASYGANSGWRSDAFTELDWVVNNCAKYGLYVVIDMHGVVGGQSTSITCGQQNQNTYWNNGNYQGDTAWMWWQIANHYKGNATVAGYDLINEPIGAPSASAVWYQYNTLYTSIRSADPGHMIIMEGAFGNWNWSMLPNPAVYGWSNVAYEMHEYQYNAPLSQVEQGSQDQVGDFNAHKSWNVPGYIGEFNDMLNSPACWDYSINLYNSAGMSWCMWAYKAAQGLLPDNWGWYDPRYMPPVPNISSDSAATIYSDWQQWQTPGAFTQNSTIGL